MNIEEISKIMGKHKRVLIPKVPKEIIIELSKIIRPVVEKGGRLYYIEPVDLFNTAYAWSPKLAEEATDLSVGSTITTYHSYSYYGFFKPTIAEVLSQLPHWEHVLDGVFAFSISMKDEDIEIDYDDEYHKAKTTLYHKKKKQFTLPNGDIGWELWQHD